MTYEEWKKNRDKGQKNTSASSFYGGSQESGYAAWKKAKQADAQKDAMSRINSWLNEASSTASSYRTRYKQTGYRGDSAQWLDQVAANRDQLRTQALDIGKYLEENRAALGDDFIAQVTDMIRSGRKFHSGAVRWAEQENKYWSQWDSEEAYNEYAAQQQDYEAKKNFDLEEGNREVAGLESILSEYQSLSRWMTDEKGQARLDQIREQYGDEKQIEALIAQKKQYMNQARHIQDGLALSGVAGNGDFGLYSGYRSTRRENPAWWQSDAGDTQYEWINNRDGFRDQYEQENERNLDLAALDLAALAYQSGIPLDPGESEYKQKGYDKLTQNEIGIYNYYYAKEGKEKAQAYLDSIQESLNRRQAEEIFSGLEGNTALELLFGVNAGLDQFKSGMSSLINTEDDYIDQSVYQIASGMVREDLEDVGPKILGNSLGQVGYDAITTTANMAPSIITSMGLGVLNPVLGQVAGTAMMGASAAGNAYQEMLNMGYDKSQARAYSALVGGSEAGLQYLLGGIGKLGGKVTGQALTKILNGVDNAFARVAIKLGGNMLSEGVEEGLQEILTPWFQNLIMHTDEKVNWSEVAYSTLLGSLTAGIMEGGGTVSGEVGNYQQGRQLQQSGVTAQRLAEVGKTFSADTVAYQLAGRVDENTGAYTLGRLFGEISAEVTAQNQADIQNSLMEKGLPEQIARKNAEVFAQVVAGGQFTEAQIAVIEANEVLAQTVAEVIIDPNSTVNQRTQGYNEMLMALAQEKTAPDASRMNPAAPGQENADTADTVDTAEESGSEGGAKAMSIASIQNRQATVKLEDGSEVGLNEANLDPDEAARIETIAGIDGISREDANFILATLRTAPASRFDALGAKEAYRYGFYGVSEDHVTKHGAFASSLNENQRKAIYNAGRTASAAQTAAKQAVVAKNAATGKKTLQVGKVHFDGNREALTERQSASLSVLEKVADALGVQIHVFESQLGESGRRIGANGWYDGKEIHIDLHAGENGEGTMLFTAAHELTHHIRAWSPEKFKTLADFLMQEYGRKGVNVEGLIRKQMDKAKRAGRTISYDTAYEEVVADSMETMLADGRVLEKLTRLKQKDLSLWQKIKDYISELAAKIRKVYEGMTPDTVEGRYVAEMKDAIEKLQDLFVEGLVDASENFRAEISPGEEGVAVNLDGEPVAYATEDGSVLLSMRTYEENGRKALRDYLQKCVKNESLTKAEMREMLNDIEEIYGICKDFKDKYAPFSAWSDAAVVRDTHGRPVFSVVTPNGDYKMNLDFSLVCKKRRTLDAVFNEMSRRGIIDDFELGQKSVVKINEIIRKYGLETACALCFVDAKRFRQASMADSFTSLYNELVESLVPEDQKGSIDHFNFSGYETIRKVEGGIDTWPASKLDFSHLDHVMKTYGKGTVEHKAAKYIKTHPEGRKLLLRGDFMSSQGFDAVKTRNKDILKLYNSKKGTGGPKAAFGDVQYMNEIIKKARTWTPDKAYAVGGVRIQSFSDYVPRMVFDYAQMIYDLAATKLPAHAYTKEALFVKQFGLTGVKINMSLIPAIAEGGIAPGLDAKGNYVWAGESFDFETAKQIQNAEGYTENCGTICVGVSYKHIIKLLSDPEIRMVIPYHKSGLNPIVDHMNKIAEFTDYTTLKTNPGGCQNTMDKDGNKVEADFNFNEILRKTGDPKETVRRYLNWCAKNEYTPRFAEFAWHENYYKLIEDFTLYDKDGRYVPQREVRAVFPKADSAFGSMKDLIREGLEEDAVVEGKRDSRLSAIVDEIQKTLPRTEAEIEEKQVQQADRDLEALKLSDRDNAPTFYSHMAKVVDGVKQTKLGAASVVSMLRGKGVKAEEIKWSGIEAWLEGKKSVTKAELQEFIAGSMLQIEEDMLTDKEIPYSQEHLDQIAKYEAERDIIAENLKTEWKRIVGTDIPITYFGAGLESAVVQNLLEANATKKGNTEAGYKYKAKRAALQRVIEDGDHYFGFDNARQAFREALRNPNDFMKSYEMTSFEKGVFLDFIKAKEAYNKVEGISMEDQKVLKAIAESADRFNNKILKVKTEHRTEAAKYLTKYRSYTIKGGTNYRELLFRMPGATYSNGAMDVHWERSGVLAHARMQDLNTFLGKMLFIEELQSDWHNEGHKSGYKMEPDLATVGNTSVKLVDGRYVLHYKGVALEESVSESMASRKGLSEERIHEGLVNNFNRHAEYDARVPEAPFKDTYHEYVLKRLLRMAAEQDYDSIGWTPAEIQVKRWSDEFAEGYRIEYDQDIPKFLNKYGKKWGTRVGKTVLDNGTEVWSMAITDEMKESVLTEGQPLYSDRDTDSVSNRALLANAFEGIAQNDAERLRLQEYREKIGRIEAEERTLANLNRKIRELSFAEGPKNHEAISEMRERTKKIAARIDTYDKQLLKLEASKPLRDILAREKQKAFQRAEKRSREAVADYRKRSAEGREKTAMRHKVQNVVGELNKLLLSNDKKHHVPDSLKKAVANALSMVNMDTVGAEERAARYAALIEQETDPDKIDAYTVSMENILRQGEKLGQYLKDLRNAYDEIAESADPDIANAYDPVIAGAMRELSQSIGNTSLRDMTIEQLSDVYDMYRMVLIRVRDANKSFLNEKKESISQLATQVAKEVRAVGGENTYRVSALDPARKFLWNNMKPVYAMETIGSATLTDAFNKVRAGEDVWAQDVTDGRAYFLAKSKKYGYDGWDFKKKHGFVSNSGLAFELTLEQILSLYAYSKREQAHEHLRLGGFVFDSNIETYKDGKLIKYKVNTADAHQITPEILADIIGTLSAEQRGFVDEMQDYLSTTMGAKGNEVTMRLYGIKLFKEKNYFPLKSAKQFLFEQNEVSGEVRIKNSGFTNKVVTKANNPVILSNFMEVWSGHVNDMSMYHAFVLPLEDFNRIFNYNSPKQEGVAPVSVKGTIQSAYSPAAVSYVKNLITDLNGGARTDSTTGVINKMMGLFKKGSVFASLSVVVQQPSAVARAAALVDTKYFIGPKVDAKRHKLLWAEVKKYAPVAIIKEMGYFDTNMGKSTQDFILAREYSGIREKMKALVTDSGYRDEILSKAPALADEMAWCSIWEAVKREIQAKHSGMDVKSEAFLHLAGQRFTEVITKTQVYDSVLSRSANMRSKDTGMKMATAFMAEPTTSINMVADALLQGKRGNRKYARKAIGAVIASQIFNSILVSFVYAARDDDEDKTYAEKYIGALTGEILDSLNPAGYIPFIKDIVSIVQGYDVERSDMAVISDLWNAWQKLDSKNLSVYRKVEGFAGSIAQIFGLPLKNIMRDVRGIYQTIDSFLKGGNTTAAGLGYAAKESLPQWMGGGATSNQNQLYEAYLNGDKAQIARVEARYEDQSSINSAIRKALRENDPRIKQAAQAKFNGDLDEYMRLAKEILSEKHFSQENVVAAINAEINLLDKGESTTSAAQKVSGMFKADDFAVAVSQNDMAMANAIRKDIIDIAQKNGKTEDEAEKSFASSASTSCRELFLDGGITDMQAIDALVDFCGYDRDEAEKRVREWNFRKEYGFDYGDRAEAYISGQISAEDLKNVLVDVGGKTEEEADKYIAELDFKAEYGFAWGDRGDAYKEGQISRYELKELLMDIGGKTEEEAELQIKVYDWQNEGFDISDSAKEIIEGYESCESAGIDKKTYYHFYLFYTEAGEDGVRNSKVKECMPYIASLPLTARQKDAIALSLWAESTVRRYKTW